VAIFSHKDNATLILSLILLLSLSSALLLQQRLRKDICKYFLKEQSP